jgi:hypothetical protein
VQSEENSTQLIEEKSEVFERLIPCIVTPLETREWWDMLLNTVERVMDVVPCYILKFDKSGRVFDTLRLLCSHGD